MNRKRKETRAPTAGPRVWGRRGAQVIAEPLFDDEETRQFYEDLIDLTEMVGEAWKCNVDTRCRPLCG